MPACLEISRERLLMVSIISHCLFQIPKNLTNSCKQWCNTTLLLLVLVRTHPVFSNWKSRILRHHNSKIFKTQKTPDMFFARVFSPPPFPQIWLELFHPSPWVVKGRLSCQVTSLPWSFQDLAKSSQGIVSVVKWTVDMIAWISPKSQIPKIICRMTPFNSTSKACLLFVYAFQHLFTIHVYFNICPLLPFFASYKSTNYISRLSSQNETNLFIETNFWPIQGMHYDPSQDPAMSIGQHCEVLKLKTYLLALTGQVRMNCGSLASPSTKTIIPSSSLTSWSRWSRPSEAPGFPTELVLVQMLAVVSLFDHCSASDDSINWNQHETNEESWMSSVFLQRWWRSKSCTSKHSQGF